MAYVALALFAGIIIFVACGCWIALTRIENEEKKAMLDDE